MHTVYLLHSFICQWYVIFPTIFLLSCLLKLSIDVIFFFLCHWKHDFLCVLLHNNKRRSFYCQAATNEPSTTRYLKIALCFRTNTRPTKLSLKFSPLTPPSLSLSSFSSHTSITLIRVHSYSLSSLSVCLSLFPKGTHIRNQYM
jgi:hypothetical protein